jgi:hypothetical protein
MKAETMKAEISVFSFHNSSFVKRRWAFFSRLFSGIDRVGRTPRYKNSARREGSRHLLADNFDTAGPRSSLPLFSHERRNDISAAVCSGQEIGSANERSNRQGQEKLKGGKSPSSLSGSMRDRPREGLYL